MLRIRNLKCFYGRIMAVKGVSLSVRNKEIISLIGANGSGKSTLLRAVSGALSTWEGDILFENTSLKGKKPPEIVKKGMSLVPEGRLLFGALSVLDNLKLGAYVLYRKKDKSTIRENLEMVYSLFPVLASRKNQPAGTLSGGEQQMLAIGRALMSTPRILLLDEPSMGLAPMLAEKILMTLTRLRDNGLTILLVEQNAQAALKIADRGYVMETGQMVLQGRAGELLEDVEVKRAYLGKDYEDFYEERRQ